MWRYWDISKTLRWTFMIYTKWQKRFRKKWWRWEMWATTTETERKVITIAIYECYPKQWERERISKEKLICSLLYLNQLQFGSEIRTCRGPFARINRFSASTKRILHRPLNKLQIIQHSAIINYIWFEFYFNRSNLSWPISKNERGLALLADWLLL